MFLTLGILGILNSRHFYLCLSVSNQWVIFLILGTPNSRHSRHFLIHFGQLTIDLHLYLVKELVVLGFFENFDRLPSLFDFFLGGNDQD